MKQSMSVVLVIVVAVVAVLSTAAAAFMPATRILPQSTQSSVGLSRQHHSSTSTSTALYGERSVAMPFMNKQPLLDGSMAGDYGFDPLGLSNIDDVGIDLYWLREAELKNSRVAMLAVVGFLQVELFGPAPGNEMCDSPNQITAFWQFWNAHPQYIAFGFIMIGLIEMFSGIATTTGRESGMRAPGDFGLDPLQFKKNPESYKRLELAEIKNGRLAMVAAVGEILQAWTTDEGAIGNLVTALKENSF